MRCQYVANRKHFSERIKSVLQGKRFIFPTGCAGRLFHADGPAKQKVLPPAVAIVCSEVRRVGHSQLNADDEGPATDESGHTGTATTGTPAVQFHASLECHTF